MMHDPRLLKDEKCLQFLTKIEENMRMMIYDAWEYGYREGFECAATQIDRTIEGEIKKLMEIVEEDRN